MKKVNGEKLIWNADNKATEFIDRMDKQILDSARASAEARELARLSIAQVGKNYHFGISGDHGYTVTVPDPVNEICPDCLAYDKWQLQDVESYSESDTTFKFKCINIVTDAIGEWECSGICKIPEYFNLVESGDL